MLGRKGAPRRVSDDVDLEGCGEGLVTVAVATAVAVSGAGHNATANADAVVVVARCAIFGLEAVAAWTMHKLALADVASACGVVWVVAVAAAVVGDASDINVGDGERVVAAVDVVVGIS